MAKNTTINLRVDREIKEQAGEILSSLGLTLSDAFNLLLHQIKMVRGLPFEVKQRFPVELDDGHGSYVCALGYAHDYSRFDFSAAEREAESKDTKMYDTADEMWKDLGVGNDDAEI